MSLTDLTLDGVSLVDTVEAVSGATIIVSRVNRPLGGTVRDEFVDVAGRDGAWVFDEEPGEILLTFDVVVLVDDIAVRRSAIQALRSWFRTPSGRKKLIVTDESDRYWDAKIPTAGAIEDDEYHGTATITFSARPYALSTSVSTEEITANSNGDSGSFSESMDYPAEPIIELTPQGGNFTGFLFTLNGYQFEWFGTTIASGTTITVSTISQTVTVGANNDMELTGVFDPDDVSMGNVSTNGFPEMVDGSNTWSLNWNGTATSVDIDIFWRERFV